jgi:hypothetical protein
LRSYGITKNSAAKTAEFFVIIRFLAFPMPQFFAAKADVNNGRKRITDEESNY